MRPLFKLYTEEDQAETERLLASPSLAYIPSPANDDRHQGAELDLDRELADLPCELPVVLAPAVTDINGNPVQEDGPTLWDLLAARRAAFVHPAAGEDESDVIELDMPARPTSRCRRELPASVPGLVTRARRRLRRRSELRQREDAARMRDLERLVVEEVVEHLPLPQPHNDDHGNDSAERVQEKPRRSLASWDDAGDLPRVIAVNRALATFGRPFAVSLNLSPEIIAKALNDNRGPLNYVRRAVARNLKRVLGSDRPFWLALETDNEGRLHAHGGIALNDNDDPRRMKEIHAEAGGNWKRPGSAPAFMRDQRDYDDPDGWAIYPFKRHARTRRAIREAAGLPADAPVTLWSCTNDIRAEGKRIHESARSAAQTARRRLVAVEVPQPATEAAAPVSEPLDAPAPASRSRRRLTTMPMMPLPIPVVAIQMSPITIAYIWEASIGVSLPTTTRSSWPMPAPAPRPVLGVQVAPIATEDWFRLPADARSRGPPMNVASTFRRLMHLCVESRYSPEAEIMAMRRRRMT